MKTLSKKIWIIALAAVVVVTAAVVSIILFTRREESYRSVLVYQISGDVSIDRKGTGNIDAYENLMLESGDKITVNNDSNLRLKLDDDKYVMVEEDSVFTIEAKGDSANSKTTINLEKGSITNEIQNKLNDKSSYEVKTSNSIMAVRGTVYRVSCGKDENGETVSAVFVFDGKVGAKLAYSNGEISDDEVIVEEGEEISIVGDDEVSFTSDPSSIDYDELPLEVLEYLKEISDSDRNLSITKTKIDELIEDKKSSDTVGTNKNKQNEQRSGQSDEPAGSQQPDIRETQTPKQTQQPAAKRKSPANEDNRYLQSSDDGRKDLPLHAGSDEKQPSNFIEANKPNNDLFNTPKPVQKPSVNPTNKPDETNKPNITNKPNKTDKPNITNKPDETDKPSETDKPDETKKPSETNKPIKTPDTEKTVYTVTFLYNGKTFGIQKVIEGEKASEPKFMPSLIGSWNHDFSKPVESDLVIEWK